MKSAAKSQHRQKFSCRAWNSSLSSGTSDRCWSAALEISSEKRHNSEVSLVCWGCAGVCWEGFGHDQTCHFSVLHIAGCFLAFLFALRPRRSLPPPLTTVHSPDSTTDRSPSLLPRVQRSPEEAFKNKAKRKKEECEPTTPEDTKRGKQEDEVRGTSSSVSGPIFKEPPEKKVRPGEVRRIKSIILWATGFDLFLVWITTVFLPLVQSAQRTTKQRSDVSCASPTFNNPNVSADGRRVKPPQVSHQRHKGKDSERSVTVTTDQVVL